MGFSLIRTLTKSRRVVPAALVVAAYSGPSGEDAGTMDSGTADAGRVDAGFDGGYDAGMRDGGSTDGGDPCVTHFNAAGQTCGCLTEYNPADGGFVKVPYCDSDIGNPCPLGCFNPKEADGGRQYMGTTPVCFC